MKKATTSSRAIRRDTDKTSKKVSLRSAFTLENIKRAFSESTEDQAKILKKHRVL